MAGLESKGRCQSYTCQRPCTERHSGLSGPGRLGDLAPASPNFIEILFRQWARLQRYGVLHESSRLRGSDNRRVHAGNAESKAEGGGDGRFEILFEKRVFQLLQPFQ